MCQTQAPKRFASCSCSGNSRAALTNPELVVPKKKHADLLFDFFNLINPSITFFASVIMLPWRREPQCPPRVDRLRVPHTLRCCPVSLLPLTTTLGY